MFLAHRPVKPTHQSSSPRIKPGVTGMNGMRHIQNSTLSPIDSRLRGNDGFGVHRAYTATGALMGGMGV